MRFLPTINAWRKQLALQGKIVLVPEFYPQGDNPPVRARLDQLHLRKIDLADEVMIIDVGGYIGEGTAREIKYAKKMGKPISYLSGRIN